MVCPPSFQGLQSTRPFFSGRRTRTSATRVRFASHDVIEYVKSHHDFTLEEKAADTWWSLDLLKETHQTARDLSLQARRKTWMVKGFEEAFETSKRSALMLSTEESVYESLQDIQVSDEILDWCRYGHSWRGLERSSSETNNKARFDASSKAKHAVFANAGTNPKAIRSAYEKASRYAKVFARIMGEADALAITQRRERCCRKQQDNSSGDEVSVEAPNPAFWPLQQIPSLMSLSIRAPSPDRRWLHVQQGPSRMLQELKSCDTKIFNVMETGN